MADYDTTMMPEENSMLRSDSIKSRSLLQLADILNEDILLHPFIAFRLRLSTAIRAPPNEYNRFLVENNRLSAPSDPNEPKPHLVTR